jgi:hypothetical protein
LIVKALQLSGTAVPQLHTQAHRPSYPSSRPSCAVPYPQGCARTFQPSSPHCH